VSIKPTIACACPVLPLPVLIREHVRVESVRPGDIDHLAAGVLTVNAAPEVATSPEVIAVKVDVIAPGQRNVACDTVLDFFPIAVKAEGVIGSGVTRIADGVVMMVTAVESDGTQAGEFGDSHGVLSERIDSSACGVPDDDVWIVRVAVTLRDGVAKVRSGPYAAHRAADLVAQRLRTTLLAAPLGAVSRRDELEEPRRPGGLRVVYAKMVMGQGAMHEKLLLPAEPHGVRGGRSIIDLGQGPVMLRVNEVLDGAIHSLCCVSPSTKETTLHHGNDPILEHLSSDPNIDLVGVAVFGSPASETDKRFTAERLAAMVSAASPEGVIVATEGFGNNHIDWSHAIAGVLKYGVPTVGVTWAAEQGRLVVGNEYLVALVETNRCVDGRETLRLGENTASRAVAGRAVSMLKTFVAGIDIAPPPARWDPAVIDRNQALADEAGVGGLADGLQSEIPVHSLHPPSLAELRIPVSQATIALVSAAGPYVFGDRPFRGAGDHTFRDIPADTPVAQITFGVGSYDHTDVKRDPNVMMPIDRLRSLVDIGAVGAMTSSHFGFNGGGGDLEALRSVTAPQLLDKLLAMHADAVIFTGG
jgi:D-proline reductase (dithiol) PrdA